MSNSPISVECINDPSGRRICVGVVDGCIFSRGCVGGQKCELHPLSAMRIGGGGVQLVELDNVDVLAVAILICVLSSFCLSMLLIAPTRQVLGVPRCT